MWLYRQISWRDNATTCCQSAVSVLTIDPWFSLTGVATTVVSHRLHIENNCTKQIFCFVHIIPNLYVDIVTYMRIGVAFYLKYALSALYICMNFVHSCVWQLFLKNKRWPEILILAGVQHGTSLETEPSPLPVRHHGTVYRDLLDQLRLLLVLGASWKPICSTFRFNWLLSFINIVMRSRFVFVVGWALN